MESDFEKLIKYYLTGKKCVKGFLARTCLIGEAVILMWIEYRNIEKQNWKVKIIH
jgi:hypothetical protein